LAVNQNHPGEPSSVRSRLRAPATRPLTRLGSPGISRRDMIRWVAAGLGSIALAGMLADEQARAGNVPAPHFAAKAKHSIVLFMPGGPSQIDLFDPKPALWQYAGQRPDAVNLRTERTTGGLLPSPFHFAKHG